MVYPVVRPSITLAYLHVVASHWTRVALNPFQVIQWSTWIPQLFFAYIFSRLRGISASWSLSPLQQRSQCKHKSKVGSNAHKSTAQHTHTQAKTWAQMKHREFTARTELKSLTQSIKCVDTECGDLELLSECLGASFMCLGVPFIAPRQLGAVGDQQGRQFLPSVGWCTGQSGAPPDSHYSMSGADLLPNLA
jgi:hypothetical protein